MDAYDIFKKLTKGLTFKHKVLGVKNTNQPKQAIKNEDIKIKKEELSDNELEEDPLIEQSDCESVLSSKSCDDERLGNENDDIQLVKGVKIGEKKKKEKKEKTEDLKKKLELEEHNRFRNEHGIKTVGRHVPPALKDFNELISKYNVSQALVDTVTQCGYKEPTPVQRQVMPCMLEDRQFLACAPTGSGKTAAFLIPILHTLGTPQGGPRALILCPTRELAQQIYREALRLSASSELRVSVVRNMKESKVKEREATIRKSDIVISTPNRLCYLLNQENVNISLDKVQWLIVDEADKLFEGSLEEQADFRQQLERVLAASGGARRRVGLLSATHTVPLARWARRLRGLVGVTVGHRNAAADTVEQQLLYCGNENGKLVAFRQIVQQGLKPPVLVFVQSKERAKQLFKELIYDGINVDVIHADRTQQQRDNVVRSFRVGRVWVLVCTELMGRGIDFRGVNLVINYDFPPSAISYIHRVGRAGRAGQKGKAITFFTQDDVANLRSIASVIKQSGGEVPEYMLRMKQDPNRRKRRGAKAPRREDISTVLKKADKRKLDASKENTDKVTDTEAVKTGKTAKHRKIQDGGQTFKKGGNKKNSFRMKTNSPDKKNFQKNKVKLDKNANKFNKKKAKSVGKNKPEFSKKKKNFVKKAKANK